jgi:hypothetical protein
METRNELGQFVKGYHGSPKTEFPKGVCPPTAWKKGMTPWNKDKRGVYTDETCKRMGMQNIGRKHTEQFKEARRQAWTGANNPGWRGGITPEDVARTSKPEWMKIAQKIRKRDNFTCYQCHRKRSTIVHHRISWHISHNDNDDNLITLCRSCHVRLHKPAALVGIAQ